MATKKETEALLEGADHWPEFRNVTYVRALYLEEDGDYLVRGSQGDTWTVDEADFHARYKPTTPNKS